MLTGDTPLKERQYMIDAFQAHESRALVSTYGAGGVGITLTVAQTVILVDRPWTPGDTVQAEDRLHRIGQQGSVTSIWVQFGGLDLRIDALLQQKQERIDQVLRGKRKTLRGLPSVRALAGEILASVRDDTPLEEFLSLYGLMMPDGSLSEAPARLPEAERVAPGVPTPATGKRSRPARHRSRLARNGLRKDGGRDRRLKGEVSRVRLNVRLDEEVVAFLRTMKASNQTTTEEGGYSGFLEERVRESREFQRWRCERQQ